jgi:hypothetical protein
MKIFIDQYTNEISEWKEGRTVKSLINLCFNGSFLDFNTIIINVLTDSQLAKHIGDHTQIFTLSKKETSRLS